MPQHYNRSQTERKIKGDWGGQFFQKQHDCDRNGKRDRRCYRGEGDIPRRFKHHNPNDAHNQCRYPVYAKKGAHQCGDPFSTSKSKPYRITVSHQRTNSAYRGAKIDKLRAGLRGLGHNHSKHDGSQAFSKIHKEDRLPRTRVTFVAPTFPLPTLRMSTPTSLPAM